MHGGWRNTDTGRSRRCGDSTHLRKVGRKHGNSAHLRKVGNARRQEKHGHRALSKLWRLHAPSEGETKTRVFCTPSEGGRRIRCMMREPVARGQAECDSATALNRGICCRCGNGTEGQCRKRKTFIIFTDKTQKNDEKTSFARISSCRSHRLRTESGRKGIHSSEGIPCGGGP